MAWKPCYHAIVIDSFVDRATSQLFDGKSTKLTRRRLPPRLHEIASRKLDQLDSAATLEDLRHPPGNRLEALRGDRAGLHSIRINQQYRICFRWTAQGPAEVEVTDYH